MFFFFFSSRRRHTRFKCDWSSDVCSSDLTILDQTIVEEWEGCLSIPDLRGSVPRYKQLRVTGVGRDAKPLEIDASDFHARVIQHETDHLKGEVYLDRMSNLRSLSFLEEWQRFMLKPAVEKK